MSKINVGSPVNANKNNSQFKSNNTRSPKKATQILAHKNNANSIKNWKNSYQELPKKQLNRKLPDTKNAQDTKNNYRYKEQFKQLSKRSSLSEVSNFILNLINKSQVQELTSTQKFMLAGYIDVYIKEKYMNGQLKDNSPPTIQKLKTQWNRLVSSWQLYKIKLTRCQIGQDHGEVQQRVTANFQVLSQEIIKISNKKQRLQPIRKLMKKFYEELIS